jgi:autotransporter-associated beta strand protein
LGSDTAFGTGPIYLAGGTLGGYDATLANDIVAVDATTSTIVPVDTLTLNGNLSGAGAITCTNVTYDNISDGALELGGDNHNFTGTFYQWEDSANGTISTSFTSASAGSDNATWQIDGGALASEVAGTPTIALGSLSGGGGALSNALAGSTVTYQIGGSNRSTEFDGLIEDGSGTVALTKVGAGRLTLTGSNTYAGVTGIESGALVIVNATAGTNLLTNTGGVNNTGGFLILDYTGGTDPASTVQSLTKTAYNNGINRFQTGQIRDTSATAAMGLGWVDNAAVKQVTIMPALYGDVNLDGTVDFSDLNILLANYGQSGKVWRTGDFSHDGSVGLTDLSLLLSNYGHTGGLDLANAP